MKETRAMTPIEKRCLEIIQARGNRDKPVSSVEIAFGIRESLLRIRDRDIPEIVHALVAKHGLAVVSNNRGYYMADGPVDVKENREFIWRRVVSLYERYNALGVIHSKMVGSDQLGFFP